MHVGEAALVPAPKYQAGYSSEENLEACSKQTAVITKLLKFINAKVKIVLNLIKCTGVTANSSLYTVSHTGDIH